MRRLSIGFVMVMAIALTACAARRQVIAPPSLSGQSQSAPPCLGGPNCEGATICPTIYAGYFSCNPTLGPAAESSEDASLGYDINAATGNLFLAQLDMHVHPPFGPDLDFVRYYNSQGNGADIGLGPNWTHSYSWSIAIKGNTAIIVADTGRVIQFTFNGTGWTAQNGEFGSLVTVVNSVPCPPRCFTYSSAYTDKFGTSYYFDSSGRLLVIQPVDNFAIEITYSMGTQISSVTSKNCALPSREFGCKGISLDFSFSGSHISSISDPAGATWLYGYTPPSIPGLVPCVPTRFIPCPAGLSQVGTGLLQTVTIPNSSIPANAVHGMTLYSYSPQSLGGRTFSPATGIGQLTGYAAITKVSPFLNSSGVNIGVSITENILGLFNYINAATNAPAVAEAASGIVAGQLLRDVQLNYGPQFLNHRGPPFQYQIITTATLNGGSKTITSTYIDQFDPRLTSITSTAGTGVSGEMQSESWKWNANLTLAAHTDGLGNVTSFSSYDGLGNPTTIVESSTPGSSGGVVAAPPRTTTICYSATSRPLVVSRPSVDGNPSHFHTLAWDYTTGGSFEVGCTQQNPTPFVQQIVEAGYTDQTLSGRIGAQEWHVAQIGYQTLNGQTPNSYPPNTHLEISSVTNPLNGAQTSFSYDSLGRLSVISLAVGGGGPPFINPFSKPAYDADGRVTMFADANGNNHVFTYDARGLLTSDTLWTLGNPFSQTNYSFDLAGNTTQWQTGGTVFAPAFDSAMRPISVSATTLSGASANGWTNSFNLDLFGKPVAIRSFLGSASSEGPACSQNGAEQFCFGLVFDPFERLIQLGTLAQDNTTTSCAAGCGQITSYYPNGLLQSRSIYQDPQSEYSYTPDSLNRIAQISVVSPSSTISTGLPSTLQYDINDNVISRSDHLGNATTYVYDDFGRRISIVSESSEFGSWLMNYDVAGNLTRSLDPEGNLATYSYDLLNRQTQYSVFAIASGNGQATAENITYKYDEQGPIPASNLQFTNTAGRLTSVLATAAAAYVLTPSAVNTHYSYDAAGWPVTKMDERGADPGVPNSMPIRPTTITWGANHEVLGMQYPDGLSVSYTDSSYLDPDGSPLPFSIQANVDNTNLQIASGITYFADGAVAALTFGNGSPYTVSRNMRGEITQVVSGPTAAPLWSESYSYNSNQIGLPTTVTEGTFPGSTAAVRTISYSPFGLTAQYSRTSNGSPTQTIQWSYDADGNPFTLTYDGVSAVNNLNNNQPSYTLPFYWTQPNGQHGNILAQSQEIAIGISGTPPISNIGYDAGGNLLENVYNIPTVGGFDANVGIFNIYNTRHHISATTFASWNIDDPTAIDPINTPVPTTDCSNGTGCNAQPWKVYMYDGEDHVWERLDNVSHLYPTRGDSVSETASEGVKRYFYDPEGRLLEEFDSLEPSGNYLVTDHIYLGTTAREMARVVSTWNGSTLQVQLTQYLHIDGHGVVAVVETADQTGPTWSDLISPFASMLSYGQISPRALLMSEEAIATTLPSRLSGLSGASGNPPVDGYIANSNTCGATTNCQIVGLLDPLVGMSSVASENVLNIYGWSPFRAVGDPPTDGGGVVGYVDGEFGVGFSVTEGPNEPQVSQDLVSMGPSGQQDYSLEELERYGIGGYAVGGIQRQPAPAPPPNWSSYNPEMVLYYIRGALAAKLGNVGEAQVLLELLRIDPSRLDFQYDFNLALAEDFLTWDSMVKENAQKYGGFLGFRIGLDSLLIYQSSKLGVFGLKGLGFAAPYNAAKSGPGPISPPSELSWGWSFLGLLSGNAK